MSAPAPKPRVPIEPGFFTIPEAGEAPRLLGSRCTSCREVFFPRRVVCARCLALGTEEVLLGPSGTLYTWTWTHLPLFGSRRVDAGGYGVGQVDLPEGPRVQAVLAGPREAFSIGMAMELDLEVLGENRDGQEVVIFRFKPGAGAQRGEAERSSSASRSGAQRGEAERSSSDEGVA